MVATQFWIALALAEDDFSEIATVPAVENWFATAQAPAVAHCPSIAMVPAVALSSAIVTEPAEVA